MSMIRTAAALGVLVTATSVHAGFTSVDQVSSSFNGYSTQQLLTGVYFNQGGAFTARDVNGNTTLDGNGAYQYTNNQLTITRVHDNGEGGTTGQLNLLAMGNTTTANDQVWNDGIAYLEAVGRYASDTTDFGFFEGPEGPTTELNNRREIVAGFNAIDIDGATGGEEVDLTNNVWRWGREDSAGNVSSSLETDNTSNSDQMLTYRIEGLTGGAYDGQVVWVTLWDDNLGDGMLFNDLMVEIIAGVAASVMPVPAPIALAAVGLFGVVLFRWKSGFVA